MHPTGYVKRVGTRETPKHVPSAPERLPAAASWIGEGDMDGGNHLVPPGALKLGPLLAAVEGQGVDDEESRPTRNHGCLDTHDHLLDRDAVARRGHLEPVALRV